MHREYLSKVSVEVGGTDALVALVCLGGGLLVCGTGSPSMSGGPGLCGAAVSQNLENSNLVVLGRILALLSNMVEKN